MQTQSQPKSLAFRRRWLWDLYDVGKSAYAEAGYRGGLGHLSEMLPSPSSWGSE